MKMYSSKGSLNFLRNVKNQNNNKEKKKENEYIT